MNLSHRRILSALLAFAVSAAVPALASAQTAMMPSAPSQDEPMPEVRSTDARLTVSHPRWGTGIRSLEFDVTYSGPGPEATCQYEMYDSTGTRVGVPVSFTVKPREKSTVSLFQVGESVVSVQVRLR